MKVLVIYNSLNPQSVAGAAMAKHLYPDCTLKDILAITTGNITTWIGTLSAIYEKIIIAYSVTTAGTGVISPAQELLLDAKTDQVVLKTGTATSAASDNTLTDSGSGWVVNGYAGMYVKTTGGTGPNQVRQIISNNSQVLTLDTAWTTPISTDTTFSICATRDEFCYPVYMTSGNKKQALVMWENSNFFPNSEAPLIIYKLAGDKTTADAVTNAQNVLDEGYLIAAAKYFLRNLIDCVVVDNWKKLMFGTDAISTSAIKFNTQDMTLYGQFYTFGKLLKESATALSVSI